MVTRLGSPWPLPELLMSEKASPRTGITIKQTSFGASSIIVQEGEYHRKNIVITQAILRFQSAKDL